MVTGNGGAGPFFPELCHLERGYRAHVLHVACPDLLRFLKAGKAVAAWLASSRPSVILFAITAVACYSVDYLFLAGK